MADNWQPAEAPPWLKGAEAKPAEPKSESNWQPADEPPWVKQGKEERGGISEAVRPITTYLPTQKEMAHEGVEQVKRGIEQLKEPTGGDLAKSAKAALYGVGNIGFGALGYVTSPIGAAYRTVVERPVAETTGSPLAGQAASFAAQLATPGIGLTRMPGAKPPPEVPTSTFAERRAGKAIERQASDIGKVKEKLETEPTEIVPGSKQSTFEMTEDPGLGAAERKAKLRSPTPYVERAEERAGARLQALEGQQETGNVADTVEHLRQSRARGEWSIEQDVALADQRAREAAELPGGQYDPATYGNVLRQELRNAEEATRAEETARWQQVDPGGRLRANPQPLQELERSIYGVMPEGGAAEASLTAAEQKVAGVIQNYPSVVPFQELRDLRHLINTQLREELITSGRSPAYARLSRLRQGIADMEEGAFNEMGVRDPDAAQRLREASTATRERAEDFGRGPVGDVLRREGSQGPFKVETAQVNDKLLPTGNKGYDVASSYLRAAPDSLEAYTDALTGKMRREVLRPDGSVDPRKLEGFLRRHDGVLRAISERDGGAYQQSLRDVGQAQERLATTLERQRASTEAFEGSELGKLVGAADNDHAINIVGNIFGRADRVDRARQLAEAVSGSPAAQAGLRRAVQQYVRRTYVGNAEAAGGTPMIPPNAFMNFMKENEAALRQIMLPEQVDSWKAIATEMGRTSRIAQTKTLPGSDTAQNAMALGQSWPWVAADMVLSHALTGVPAPLGHAAKPILKGLLSHVKKNGITSTNKLIDEAMLNPEVARELLKAKERPSAASVRMQQTAPGLLRTGTLRAATPDDEQKRKPRQAGGGIPAIGGTGGRSPGAREASGAGAARGGTGQALQDGGEAREQQAAAPVGGRERFAAALQGTPTGAGFNVGGGGGQQSKGKALKTPSREDVRRTLQSFGITGETAGGFAERQLGEVDSRAEGGVVEDRWANLPDSRNIEDRRNEEPLSPGQMIAGNQAFMGHYPSPYTRGSRRPATAQARADGGGVDDALHQGLMPSTLLDETKKYLADQIGGVEDPHEQQDPLEAAVKHSGAQKNPPGYGGSDEGDVNSFEAAAARTRRRAPVRAPDPASLAASQGGVSWGDYARHKLEQGIKTATAPGRAYKQGMTPDEEIEAAQGMAGLMAGSRLPGVAAGAAEGTLGIFGGKGSKTADLDMMHRAMEMRDKGVSAESVWNRTGWFRGPEGLWRYEIPDYEARMKPSETVRDRAGWMGEEGMARPTLIKRGELRDIAEHPEFERAYRGLMGMPASMELGVKPGGGYLPPDWLLRNPGDRGSMEVMAPRSKETFAGDIKEDLSEITPRRIMLHELQHAVQQAEDFTGGANPNALPFSDRQIATMTKKKVEAEGIPWQMVNPFDRQNLYRAMRQSIYEKIAGEVEARNVERRRDIEGHRPPPWKTEDIPRAQQLVWGDPAFSFGFKPPKGQKPFKKPVPYAEGGEVREPPLPDAVMDHWGSETDAVQEAAERAALRQRRGVLGATTMQGTGRGEDKYPRSERDMPMVEALAPTSPLDYAMMALPYRLPAKAALLGLSGLLSSTSEAEAGPAGKAVQRIVTQVGRHAPEGGGYKPGIYKDPRVVAQEAAELVPPEHEALHKLFDVHRGDLYDISQQGRRPGNLPDPPWVMPPPKARGSVAAEGVMNPENAQRILDAMAEAGKHPGLRLSDAWYVMDPAYQRLEYLHGPELAKRLYDRMNITGAMTSPASGVWDEIRRGTAANMMAHQGRFPEWEQWAGIAMPHRPQRGQPFEPIKGVTSPHVEHLAGQKFPPELREVPGHMAHRTAHGIPIANYLESGAVDMGSAKVPVYIPASGVPETGFQTRWMVPDAHISKSMGMGDTRTPGTIGQGASMSMPEYRQIGPWYRQNIAEPLGIEAVPAQARQWTLFGPQTGVRTHLGVPKLELLAQRIWERALKHGWDPKVLRDQVLSGGAHAGLAGGVIAPAVMGARGEWGDLKDRPSD